MAFRVKQTAQADHDLDVILEWLISQQAGETGQRWFRGLKDTLNSLSELPHRCSLAPENVEFPFEVRQLLYGRKPHQYRGCCSPWRRTRFSFFIFDTVAGYPLPSTDEREVVQNLGSPTKRNIEHVRLAMLMES